MLPQHRITQQVCSRGFHSSASPLVRFTKLKLRAPIIPRAKNLKVRDDHPLWQFFSDKRFMRPLSELDNVGRAWTIQELRRKSFEDLHALWYVCLRERNILLRESQIYKTWNEDFSDQDKFRQTSDEIHNTMWRIRHVLSERDHSYRNGLKEFRENYDKLVKEFEERYLTADDGRDAEMEAQLERFQYMIYGVNPMLEGNFPNENTVAGIKTVAKLKLDRFNSQENPEVTAVEDINEAYILFTSEHSVEGIEDAVKSILEYRAIGNKVLPEQEYEVLGKLIFRYQEAQKESVQAEELSN